MSAEGWIRLDAGALERLASIAVCVAAPVLLRGALIIEAFVEPGRLTTLRLPPF